jgi:hypothetical protein
MNIGKFKGKIDVLSVQDEKLRWFLNLSFFAVIFLCFMGGGYSGLKMLLIPYYQAQQLSEQQIAFENELQKAPIDEPGRWQQFESLSPSFHFTNIKIKAAFYSLCQRHDVRLKGGQIQDALTEGDTVFKPAQIVIAAKTDAQIFAFLQHLTVKLAGVLVLKVIKVHRSRDLNEALITKIKAGKDGDLVEAKIEFEWLVFKK